MTFKSSIFLTLLLGLTSCGASTIGGTVGPVQMLTQNQTIGIEAHDRINRFDRMSLIDGIKPPLISVRNAPSYTVPGVSRPVPVVEVTFPEGVFFHTNRAQPIQASLPIIKIIAQNMARDVPDAALTIVGNTDSTGPAAYNDALSSRRALNVMKLLSARGVDPLQMTTVAIGDRQPVASNATAEGRALNRRVEFFISASTKANLVVIQNQHVNRRYLPSSVISDLAVRPETVTVLQGHDVRTAAASTVALAPVGSMQLVKPRAAGANVKEAPLAPPPVIHLRPLQVVQPARLQ